MLGQQQQQPQHQPPPPPLYYSPGSSSSGGAGGLVAEGSQLVKYVEDYLECVESLPLEIQRSVSLLREIDTKYREALKEIDDVFEKQKDESDPNQKKRLLQQLQRALIVSQELGDDKIQIVTQVLELVENRTKQMEAQCKGFYDPTETEKSTEKQKVESNPAERSTRRPRRQRNSESRDLCHMVNGIDECEDQPPKEKKTKSSKKKKRSKAKQEREMSPIHFAIDPNEPTYCLCNQVSYGEMIGCDNECSVEWFHFSCVGLTYKPKGKWYCPDCRGDNEKTMTKNTDKIKKDRRSR
ncbi:inhibitor of growth protein 2 [Ascaphus truei]|uniref:inhibitor of growth protein 2 n=1 Tax=Ascaphus truei TaxID=8439 RepID=UPI003F5A4E80